MGGSGPRGVSLPVRRVLLLSGATALGQGLVVASSPLLTRLYGPGEFGVLAVFTALLSVLAVGALRYELAIPLPADEERARHVLVLCLGVVALASVLVAAAVAVLGDVLVGWVGTPGVRPYLPLLAAGVAVSGVRQVLALWAIRGGGYPRLARARVCRGVGQVAIQIGGGLAGAGAVALIAGHLLGQVASGAALAPRGARLGDGRWRRFAPAGIRAVARRYRRFPLLSGSSLMLNVAGLHLPALMLAGLYGPQTAGWYALGQRVVGTPMRLVGQAAAQVYLSEAGRLLRRGSGGLSRLLRRTSTGLLLAGAAPLALLAATGPWAFALVFGEPWRQAGTFVRLLSGMALAQLAVSPVSHTLNVTERQELQLLWDALRLLLVIAALWGSSRLGLDARGAVAVYGGAMALAYAALYAACARAAARREAAG